MTIMTIAPKAKPIPMSFQTCLFITALKSESSLFLRPKSFPLQYFSQFSKNQGFFQGLINIVRGEERCENNCLQVEDISF